MPNSFCNVGLWLTRYRERKLFCGRLVPDKGGGTSVGRAKFVGVAMTTEE